jgi:hypothetical protein
MEDAFDKISKMGIDLLTKLSFVVEKIIFTPSKAKRENVTSESADNRLLTTPLI